MGRTNIVIDDKLMREVLRVTGAKTKREAVDTALRRIVDKASLYAAIRRLRGKIRWEGDLKAWRKKRVDLD